MWETMPVRGLAPTTSSYLVSLQLLRNPPHRYAESLQPIHSFAPVDAMASRAIIISCQWHIRIVGVPAGGERRSAQKTAGCSRGDLAWLAGFLGIIG